MTVLFKRSAEYGKMLDRADQQAIRDDLLTVFGPRAEKFLAVYDKMRAGSGFRRESPVSWCWPAFFLPFVWFFYRKMYVVGALFVVLPFILDKIVGTGTSNVGLAITSGIYAKAWYVQSALGRVRKADAPGLAGAERTEYLRRAGGVSVPAAAMCLVVLAALFSLAVYGIYHPANHS